MNLYGLKTPRTPNRQGMTPAQRKRAGTVGKSMWDAHRAHLEALRNSPGVNAVHRARRDEAAKQDEQDLRFLTGDAEMDAAPPADDAKLEAMGAYE